MTRLRLLLVDDHVLFRESLRRLLSAEPDLDVVGDCATVDEARDIVRNCVVDMVLLDFDLGGAYPLGCVAALQRAGYAGKILMVTAGMTAIESSMALRCGASGVFLKHSSPSALTQAIRLVANGSTWFDQSVLQHIADRSYAPGGQPPQGLTFRQRRVLEGVFEGLANKEIGARLNVSESAVKTTLQQLFHKSGVRTRSQLVRVALERSFLRAQGSLQDSDRNSTGA